MPYEKVELEPCIEKTWRIVGDPWMGKMEIYFNWFKLTPGQTNHLLREIKRKLEDYEVPVKQYFKDAH